MNKIAKALGLPETATEEEILAAIADLQGANTDFEKEVAANRKAEGEALADKQGIKDEANRRAFVNRFVEDPAGVKAIFGLLPATEQKKDPEPAVRPLANRSSAKTPVVGDEADAEAKARAEKSAAVSLANRATEISRTQGIAYNRAFKQAQREAAAKA